MDIPSLDTCLTVSNAIRKKGTRVDRVDRETYKTHVPQWVDTDGNIHPAVIEKAVEDGKLPNKPFDHPINWERFYDRRLEEITPKSCVRVAKQVLKREKPHPDDYAHAPIFVSRRGFITPSCLELLNY